MDTCYGVEEVRHPRMVHNRQPTPQDLLELSSRIYKPLHKLHAEADSQGMRVYHDELLVGDVRLVMLVPQWFPKAHVSFDWSRLQGDRVSVVFVLRGTMQDLVGNTKANLQLIYNKLVDDQHLPDTATDATKVIQAWLLTLLRRHPQLDAAAATSSSGDVLMQEQQQQQPQQEGPPAGRVRLDVHITGHSLGGLLAEVATVESAGFAARHGAEWHCTSFESPGLPDLYHDSALRIAPEEHWHDVISSYLAAPNVINMLYRHLGRITHVVVPWEHTWTFMAKCVGADVARITAWAIIGSMVVAGASQVAGVVRRRSEDELADRASAAATTAAATNLTLQQCNAALPHVSASASAPAALNAANGPELPQFLLVAATPSSASDTAAAAAAAAAGRRLLAPLPTPAAVATAVGAAAGPQPASTLAGTAVAAVAAAGEAAASLGGGRILHGVLRRSGLGTLAAVLGGWVWGRGGIWGVMECLAGVLGVEVEELICQHALGPMRQCFDPHTGEIKPRYCRRMASWPHLGSRGRVIVTAAKQVAKWTLPSFVCRDNLGVANIMSRTAMVEARCARLQGYEVLEDTEEVRRALGLLGDNAAAYTGASDMYMPLEAPDTPMEEQQQPQEQQEQQQEHASLVHRHRQGLPAPRGLGMGLARHAHGRRPGGQLLLQAQQHEQEHLLLGVEEHAAADLVMPPAQQLHPIAGSSWGADEAAAMAVDAAEAAAEALFADAVEVGPDDLLCEGLPEWGPAAAAAAGAPSHSAGGFISVAGGGVGGAFDPLQLPRVTVTGQEEAQQARQGHMQLHFNGGC